MSELQNLINQKVVALIKDEDNDYQIQGIVIGVDINDFYFYEKGEPIYVSVSINPTDDLPGDIDFEDLTQIPLDCIRKA